jgi:hypothetical protein
MRSYLLVATLLTCTCLPAFATTILNDGLSHNIDGSGPFDQVSVTSNTTANILSGANVVTPPTDNGSDAISAYDSIVNMFGGTISGGDDNLNGGFGGQGINALNSTVNISGGILNGGAKDYANGGGFGGNGLYALDSYLNISGGTLNGGINTDTSGFGGFAFKMFGTSIADVTGGLFNHGTGGALTQGSIGMSGTSVLNLSGGSLSHRIQMTGDSILNVFGTGLFYDATSFGSHITGTLADGTSIDTQVYMFSSGQVNIHNVAVPEPSIIALFGLGLVGLGFARRRQS